MLYALQDATEETQKEIITLCLAMVQLALPVLRRSVVQASQPKAEANAGTLGEQNDRHQRNYQKNLQCYSNHAVLTVLHASLEGNDFRRNTSVCVKEKYVSRNAITCARSQHARHFGSGFLQLNSFVSTTTLVCQMSCVSHVSQVGSLFWRELSAWA